MMSAAQNQTTLESKLKALECHFTWDLEPSRSTLFRRRDKLEDIGTEEGNKWLGHIYNLRGFVQYKLGFTEDAQSLFNKAADAFRQMRNADDGPWLVVNYGNLAWLHHQEGDQTESEAYVSKVDALMSKYPFPDQDELHAEICAEKAWTLMKFSADQKLLAGDYFQRAIGMQPDMVEWNTTYVLGLVKALGYKRLDADILERMRIAKEKDPENLHLAINYIEQCANRGDRIEEARELARQILRNPVSSYSGMNSLLWVFKKYLSIDEAIDMAEQALNRHPDERYLKRCAALCYKWKILHVRKGQRKQIMIDRAISLFTEVISLYPDSSFAKKIDLANIYSKSIHNQTEAELIFQELLESAQEPADKQMLYNQYARFLHNHGGDDNRSIQYHMDAAEILYPSYCRQNSIKTLRIIRDRCRGQRWREIKEFLEKLPEP